MLRPVVEIYVVRHPRDTFGKKVGEEILGHFRSTRLVNSPMETYMRSTGFAGPQDAPEPIPFPGLVPCLGGPPSWPS